MKYNCSALVALGLVVASVPAWAQDGLSEADKTIPGGTLAVTAYIVFVAMMLGYLALLSWRQRRLDADIDALEKRLDELAELGK